MTTSRPDTPPANYSSAPAGNVRETFARRPGTVTTATILAMIWGGLTIISSLVSMVGGSLLNTASACALNDQSGLCAFVGDSSGLLIVVGSALIVAAMLVIWGSIVARNRTSAKVLVIASGIQIVIQIVWTIDTGSMAFGIVGVIVPAAIIGLIVSPGSRAWFQGNGGAKV
jgi:hypothetical protein